MSSTATETGPQPTVRRSAFFSGATQLARAVHILNSKRFITPVSFHRDIRLKHALEFSLRYLHDATDDTDYWQATCHLLPGVTGWGVTEEAALTFFFSGLLHQYRDLQFEYSLPGVSLRTMELLDGKLTRLYRHVSFAPRVFEFVCDERDERA